MYKIDKVDRFLSSRMTKEGLSGLEEPEVSAAKKDIVVVATMIKSFERIEKSLLFDDS